MNKQANPTQQQVLNFVNNATPIFLGRHEFKQHELPIGKDNIFTLLFNIIRPTDKDSNDAGKYSLTDYRKFNKMLDGFCNYLENHLPLATELRIKEITDSKNGFYSTCIYADVKVNHH